MSSRTVQQIAALARAGSELVRVTVNNDAAAKAVPAIVEGIRDKGWETPIIGDFHYNGHLLLRKYPETAQGAGEVPDQSGQLSRSGARTMTTSGRWSRLRWSIRSRCGSA